MSSDEEGGLDEQFDAEDDSETDGQIRGSGHHGSDEETESSHHNLVKSLERTFAGDSRKRKMGGATRTEAAKEINQFNFTSGRAPALTLDKVMECILDEGEGNSGLKKSDRNVQASVKILTKPLEKPVADKIKRTVIYDNVKKDISKWNSVVYHNRAADQLVFPLSASKKLPRKTTKDAASEFVPETLLEEEMAKILHGEDFVRKKKAEVHDKEVLKSDAEAYVMGIEEALEKHGEMARLRALQSYEQIKAKRQSKIKSKKYHRLLRREKIRKQLKEFEQLQKTDPEAALVKLEELDKSRIQERMSLKHRNTSKWAKMQSARAKYDRDSRSALSDQLKISRELTKKVGMESSEDEDDEVDFELPNLVKSSLSNPWMLDPSVQENEKMNMYYTGFKKVWQAENERREKERQKELKIEEISRKEEEKSKNLSALAEDHPLSTPEKDSRKLKEPPQKKKTKKKFRSKDRIEPDCDLPKNLLAEDEDVTLDVLDRILDAAEQKIKTKATRKLENLNKESTLKRKKSNCAVRPKKLKNSKGDAEEIRDLNVDESQKNSEGVSTEIQDVDLISLRKEGSSSMSQKLRQPEKVANPTAKVIDPSNFLKIGKSPTFQMGAVNDDELALNDEVESETEDPEEERLKIIAEAFEDEDLLEEFKKRKQEIVEAQTPKDINLALPGWGDWGGQNIKPNMKKRKRFTLSAPPPPPRQDARISHVILNDEANSKLKEHQVRALPFPFKRVQDFEKMIRAPVGRTWLPEPAMKSLTAPKVITRLGAVIQPIDEDVLINKMKLSAKEPKLTGLKLSSFAKTRKPIKTYS